MKTIQLILYFFLAVIFIVSLIMSDIKSDYMWFARCGALITVIPILISIMDFYSDRAAIYYAKHNYAVFAPANVEELANKYWPIKVIINAIITIIGTIIWGFGDLLGKWL
ncbi:MAG: hypothetical protein HY807_03185 [Nitrospirae bacterium]|nr:hypothetical protein [Nitrospirota bacterium]